MSKPSGYRSRFSAVASGLAALGLFVAGTLHAQEGLRASDAPPTPTPLLAAGKPVAWWFVFKFNAKDFPGCGGATLDTRRCTFDPGMSPPKEKQGFGQQYVVASSDKAELVKGEGCAGETADDPLGATYGSIFEGGYHYVAWNDQPQGHPSITGCTLNGDCSAPWGHSKGLLAWNDAGEGVVLQVTTPSWPLSASKAAPRAGDANTLGCVEDDDVKLSQHFFALKLNKEDLISVLLGMQNASVGTDPSQLQLVNNGGPEEIKALVTQLGTQSHSTAPMRVGLSSGVGLLSKPSRLQVPPWQLVSAAIGGIPLRTATFWNAPKIPTTTATTPVGCWDPALGTAGAVEIALSGQWEGKALELGSGGNHAKIGVSLLPEQPFVIFGDENQQGALSGTCKSSQNGRGGLFFVLRNSMLADSVRSLLKGETGEIAGGR